MTSVECTHLDAVEVLEPPAGALGCEECLAQGMRWVHLRMCQSCGHIGCCDNSPGKHATAHYEATGHPIIEGYDPPEGWGWCFVDDTFVRLDHKTEQIGPIKRWV